MGGRCIYCGDHTTAPGHLDVCLNHPEVNPTSNNNNCCHDRREEVEPTPGRKRPSFVISPSLLLPTNQDPDAGTARISPSPDIQSKNRTTSYNSYKKPRPSPDQEEYTFQCLTCGRNNCPYENGYTVLSECDENHPEFDPCEPTLETWKQNHSGGVFSFDDLKSPIQLSVAGVVQSKDFWSNHKYLGSTSLDVKVQAWMKQRIKQQLVEDNWILLRRAVKEALRYKRQESVEFIRSTYFGACVMVSHLSSSCQPSHRLSFILPKVLESTAPSGYYRRHLLRFGSTRIAVDLSQEEETMKALAWVVRHFVPMIAERPKHFWESLLSGKPLSQYMTTSDLAFAVLVLEHHMMQWRHLIQFQLETGEPPSDEY